MRTSFLNIIGAGAGIILASATLVCGQPVLYQSTTVDTGTNLNFANNQEIGQEIWLGTGVTPVWLTNLSFEYYSPVQAFNGNVKMDVIIYANSGPKFNGYKSPGIVLYNSGLIPLLTPYFVDGTERCNVQYYPVGFAERHRNWLPDDATHTDSAAISHDQRHIFRIWNRRLGGFGEFRFSDGWRKLWRLLV